MFDTFRLDNEMRTQKFGRLLPTTLCIIVTYGMAQNVYAIWQIDSPGEDTLFYPEETIYAGGYG